MWNYEKRLEYPINIKQTDPKAAQYIISQYGGPDGELAASLRYLSQRYAMPYREVAGVLTDIGTEELAHFEMIATIVHQLTRNLTPEEINASGFGNYYIDHTLGIWPQAAGGIPFNANITPIIPAIGSTIPENCPIKKHLPLLIPSRLKGIDTHVPSGKFCIPIPTANIMAATRYSLPPFIPAHPNATPTARPSGIL